MIFIREHYSGNSISSLSYDSSFETNTGAMENSGAFSSSDSDSDSDSFNISSSSSSSHRNLSRLNVSDTSRISSSLGNLQRNNQAPVFFDRTQISSMPKPQLTPQYKLAMTQTSGFWFNDPLLEIEPAPDQASRKSLFSCLPHMRFKSSKPETSITRPNQNPQIRYQSEPSIGYKLLRSLADNPPMVEAAEQALAYFMESNPKARELKQDALELYNAPQNTQIGETISFYEASALMLYNSDSHAEINNLLRSDQFFRFSSPLDVQKWMSVAVLADSALKKCMQVPDLCYEGKVYRSVSVLNAHLQFNPEKTGYSEYDFSSSSTLKNQANVNEIVQLAIDSKTGVKVDSLSFKPDEHQVLFRPGTQFKISNVEVGNKSQVMDLTEISTAPRLANS